MQVNPIKPYQPMRPEVIGNTVSCQTLARMLNEIASTKLTKKVIAHIMKYFADTKYLSAGIYGYERRQIIGNMLIRELDGNIDLVCPENIKYVIRNVKLAYIKDLFINEIPLNYKHSFISFDEYDDFDESGSLIDIRV